MKVRIIIKNINNDTFFIENSKKNELIMQEKELYVHYKYGALIEGRELIEKFKTIEQCEFVYKCIKNFINRKKEIQEVINLIKKDIKLVQNEEEKMIFKKFLLERRKELLKYNYLSIKDIIKKENDR